MKTVLVVENNEYTRNKVKDILLNKGYSVITALNGIDGINKAVENIPDLIISEIEMPILDGIEMLLVIRKNKLVSNVPLILLTSKTSYEENRIGINQGANDLLQKPFSSDDLLNCIDSVFNKIQNMETSYENLKNNIFMGVNHEFRTPLAPIMGFTQLLQDEFKETVMNSEIKEVVTYLSNSIKKYHSLVKKFTKYTNITLSMNDENYLNSSKKQVIYSPKLEIIKYAIKAVDSFNRSEDIQFDIIDIPINFDELFFSYVVEELVSNAVKYSEPGNKIEVSGKIEADKYQLSVRNEGFGLTKEQIKNITAFPNNFEADSNASYFLGLNTIKRMLTLTNSTMKIDSKLGEYTEISIKFDLAITSNEYINTETHIFN